MIKTNNLNQSHQCMNLINLDQDRDLILLKNRHVLGWGEFSRANQFFIRNKKHAIRTEIRVHASHLPSRWMVGTGKWLWNNSSTYTLNER